MIVTLWWTADSTVLNWHVSTTTTRWYLWYLVLSQGPNRKNTTFPFACMEIKICVQRVTNYLYIIYLFVSYTPLARHVCTCICMYVYTHTTCTHTCSMYVCICVHIHTHTTCSMYDRPLATRFSLYQNLFFFQCSN